jgi:hypothetical protein
LEVPRAYGVRLCLFPGLPYKRSSARQALVRRDASRVQRA